MVSWQTFLKQIPQVDELLRRPEVRELDGRYPGPLIKDTVRQMLDQKRQQILAQQEQFDPASLSGDCLAAALAQALEQRSAPRLRQVINATGVVIHTNLGRSILPEKAIEAIVRIGLSYNNLEMNLDTGKRGSRYAHVEGILGELTGAEAALVVNNNAAAVLIVLQTMAAGREVIVSRGQLIEIGGSFRIPEVMQRSGGILVEVGTTNKTHLRDYEEHITPNTAALMRVHTSNYRVVGFTKEVTLAELAELGRRRGIPVIEDLGSGNLVDLSKYGILGEPRVQDVVAGGADVVTFSGDKLLGGPQAGVIVGKKQYIDEIKKNPLNRAMRIDKFTLAALEATLGFYRDERVALQEIPTLRMITMSDKELAGRAGLLLRRLKKVAGSKAELSLVKGTSQVGGGALPTQILPTTLVAIHHETISAHELEQRLRGFDPPIMTRIEKDQVLLDPRTLSRDDEQVIIRAAPQVLH
ncbi:MAG: L-seryl-tRNA(Sec) selenium transferase [Deltaproteobacteria bacterium]|nr:L-seryl-tRNA(Sec) selenium transferase [Deltaproteobacteria bacterium]